MARRITQQAEAPGQDSFLDVVANLVGIMIILIIVVGAATKKAMVAAGSAALPAAIEGARDEQGEVEELRAMARGLAQDVEQTETRLMRDLFEIRYRQTEREKLLTRVSVAEKVIAQKREQLDLEQQAQFDASSQLNAAQAELSSLRREKEAARQARPTPGIIEHLPTPMAKTVFGKEYHFRLNAGRIVQVPWDQLVEKLKADAPIKAPRLKDSPTITETIGPLQGFWMKYTLRLTTTNTVSVRGGAGRESRVQLEQFVMLPVSEEIGEPMAEALRPNSDFMAAVKGLNPERTTITVWVYPDSFNEYRELKQALFVKGFLTAARPLPPGQPLGGSPDGSRSSAQ